VRGGEEGILPIAHTDPLARPACPLFLSSLPSPSPPSGLLPLTTGADVRLCFTAAGAIAAYLRPYVCPPPLASSNGLSLHQLRPVPPPAELLTPARLAAVLKLLRYVPPAPAPGGPPPMAMEGLEGVPCRSGLFDGVVALIQVCVCVCVCMWVWVCGCVCVCGTVLVRACGEEQAPLAGRHSLSFSHSFPLSLSPFPLTGSAVLWSRR
jgi:hypothetical protein